MIRKGLESYVSPVASLQSSVNGESDFDKHQKFPLTVLQQEADALPAGVNPTRKEVDNLHKYCIIIWSSIFILFFTGSSYT